MQSLLVFTGLHSFAFILMGIVIEGFLAHIYTVVGMPLLFFQLHHPQKSNPGKTVLLWFEST